MHCKWIAMRIQRRRTQWLQMSTQVETVAIMLKICWGKKIRILLFRNAFDNQCSACALCFYIKPSDKRITLYKFQVCCIHRIRTWNIFVRSLHVSLTLWNFRIFMSHLVEKSKNDIQENIGTHWPPKLIFELKFSKTKSVYNKTIKDICGTHSTVSLINCDWMVDRSVYRAEMRSTA